MQDFNGAAIFKQEAEELLLQIEDVLLELDPHKPSLDAINQLFRAFHTIKGSGHMFGFEAIAAFTHHVESALDEARNGSLPVTPELVKLVLAARDRIRVLLEQRGSESEEDSLVIIRNLEALGKGVVPVSQPGQTNPHWLIRFRPLPSAITCGINIGSVLRDVRSLGTTVITTHVEDVPTLENLQTDTPYVWWDIKLDTTAELAEIKNAFLFVEDDCELSIEAAASAAKKVTATPVHQEVAQPVERKAPASSSSVRVASERLDHLVNLVGELVMNQSRLTQSASTIGNSAITAPVEEIERLVSELRDCVLAIRMMPIGSTFSRFKRLVHDLGAELHKEVDLITEGADTELDKTVLDQIGDPLVHLIRNSMDHGVESAEERRNSGKRERASIRLSAKHVGSNVVISIHDDGRGINPQAIRAKAIERGMLSPEAELTSRDLLLFIFAPGFSTAKQVTNLSGRGVGMDVVKRQIDALRGVVGIESEVGKGTTVSLTLPLTLAIIDGLLVQVAGDQFIIPMSAVMENVELPRTERYRNNGRNVIAVRGELVPYIRLRDTFCVEGQDPDLEKIVIASHENERVGIVVDRVLGSHQTVIQSLGTFYRNVDVLSGATIMGDGRVALILDIAGLIRTTKTSAINAA